MATRRDRSPFQMEFAARALLVMLESGGDKRDKVRAAVEYADLLGAELDDIPDEVTGSSLLDDALEDIGSCLPHGTPRTVTGIADAVRTIVIEVEALRMRLIGMR